MKSFELYDAYTVQEAVGLLNKFGPTAKVVAGGSDLVTGIMKDWVRGKGLPSPEKLIDVTTIPELVGIKIASGSATIGAATTLTSIFNS
jgi:aerobic carbon-monoxide dehydrogenase medium subunit